MPLNKIWHQANPMPDSPTLDQRVAWHEAHSREGACREVPASIRAEIERRKRERSPS
jgi:hypothetical protein